MALPASFPPAPPLGALPRRDEEALTRLSEAARRAKPLVLARERVLTVPGELGAVIPGGALRRGATVTVDGAASSGATSVVLGLAAAATATGEWVGAIDLDGTLGAEAAAAAGVVLARLAVVRRVPPERWATATAALLDGVTIVLTEVPRHPRAADARQLVARARERGAVLLVQVAPGRHWPADASLRLRADGGPWAAEGAGLLASRERRVVTASHGISRPTGARGDAVAS